MVRIWDKYLSDRDRIHLERTGEPPRVGFGDRPALLLIDNYKAGLGERPQPLLEALEEFPLSMGLEAWDAIARTKELLELCREVDVPAIHVNMLAEPNSPWEFYTNLRLPTTTLTRRSTPGRLNPGGIDDMFEIHPDVAPLEDEILIRKLAPSAFWGTPLISVLQSLRVDTVLVTGESTSGCVRATVVDAASHNLRTIVVEECVYDRTEASHALNLLDMHYKYGDVCPVKDVMEWLQTRAATVA